MTDLATSQTKPGAERIAALRWFHSMDLGDGIVTQGVKASATLKKEADIIFRHGISGDSVLDIGAWDGFFSFEAERRGASRVLATDKFCWDGEGWGKKITFETARAQLGSKVDDKTLDVFSLTPDSVGTFDTVLFLGVLYHLHNPYEGLLQAAKLARRTLVVETVVYAEDSGRPLLYFFDPGELNNDPTNFYAPNITALKKMLHAAGFSRVEITSHPSADPMSPVRRLKYRAANLIGISKPMMGRVIAHAWR